MSNEEHHAEEDPRLSHLRDLFPEMFLDGKPDLTPIKDLLGLTDADETDEKYGLNWNGKKQAKDSLKKSPKGTLLPDLEDSIDFDNAENIFIEGDNLEVLKLLQRGYNDKVKLIYIDPPYNTGNDFVYNDDFSDSLKTYLEYTNQKDAEGMATSATLESGGRKHSGWLSMMYPRLVLARNLLSRDGVIAISIDDNEAANLKLVMDEIFGQENFLNTFIWVSNLKGRQISGKGATSTKEYLFLYARNIDEVEGFKAAISLLKEWMPTVYKGFDYEIFQDEYGPYVLKNELHNTNSSFNELTRPNLVYDIYFNPETNEVKTTEVSQEHIYPNFKKISPHLNNNGANKFHAFRWSRSKVEKESHNLEFTLSNGKYKVFTKVRDVDQTTVKDLIVGVNTTTGSADVAAVGLDKRLFDYPKPVALIRLICAFSTSSNSLVLDFFAGSGTTAHAVMAQNVADGGNRRFILVNLPEPTPEGSAAREDGFENICDITRLRIKKSAEAVGVEDFKLRCFRLGESNFNKWEDRVLGDGESGEDFLNELSLFVETRVDGASGDGVVAEVLVGEGVPLDVPWERLSVAGADVVKVGGVVVCLADVFSSDITEGLLGLSGVEKLVVLEDSFVGAESEKVNLSLGCERAGIVLRSV